MTRVLVKGSVLQSKTENQVAPLWPPDPSIATPGSERPLRGGLSLAGAQKPRTVVRVDMK
jgi:hypothetical protein